MILLAFSKIDWATLMDCFLKILTALSKIDWTTFIDWFLRILQIITFLALFFKISFKKEYIANVDIRSINPDEYDSLNSDFHFIHNYDHSQNCKSYNHFLFYPKGIDIKKVDFFSLEFNEKCIRSKSRKEFFETKIHSISNIRNNEGLLIHTNIPDTIPQLRMRWETSSGEIGEYTFRFNGYNGNTNISEYLYKLTWKKKLSLIFGQ